MNWGRVTALILRYLVLYRRNVARWLDLAFWPVAELIIWGFVSLYLMRTEAELPVFVGYFLGAVILWSILFRADLGVAINFLEDLWTRNFLNLFASPLTPREFLVAVIITSFIKVLANAVLLIGLALLLYGFNLFDLGLPLVGFFLNLLLMGWSLGILTIAIILRFGQNAEVLAWAVATVFQPFSAVFYPVSVLPEFFQVVARFVPASHVFEGMRTVLSTGSFDIHAFLWALGLNAVYLVFAIGIFSAVFARARRDGRLVRLWE